MLRPFTMLLLGLATCAGAVGAQSSSQPPRRLPTTTVTTDATPVLTVQNNRASAVTVYARSGLQDRRLAVVDANATTSLPLPSWATKGQRTITLVSRADWESLDFAPQTFALGAARDIGLLIPATGGFADENQISTLLSPEERASTTVTVENPRAEAVTVYVEQGSWSVRLGEVSAKAQATLRVPPSLLAREQALRVFVRPAGGRDQVSELVRVKRGDHVGVRVSM